MDTTKQEIAERLQSLHQEAGQSYGDIQRFLTDKLGTALAPTTTTVFRWHERGIEPSQAPIEQLRVLCEFYSEELDRSITLVDIHQDLAERWDTVRRIATTSRWSRSAA